MHAIDLSFPRIRLGVTHPSRRRTFNAGRIPYDTSERPYYIGPVYLHIRPRRYLRVLRTYSTGRY